MFPQTAELWTWPISLSGRSLAEGTGAAAGADTGAAGGGMAAVAIRAAMKVLAMVIGATPLYGTLRGKEVRCASRRPP
jgi:hypothetical protein